MVPIEEAVIKRLLDAGAHLVRCGADKVPFDKAWQDAPWSGAGETVHVGMVPGRSDWLVVDVDVKGIPLCDDPEAILSQRISEVHQALGGEVLVTPTPSGGAHLWYPVFGSHPAIPNGKLWSRGRPIGDLRCDGGFVVLWEPEAVAHLLEEYGHGLRMDRTKALDKLAELRKAPERAAGGHSQRDSASTPGGGSGSGTRGARGHVEGDRNEGLYAKVFAALMNDADPEPAIDAAVDDAVRAGLSLDEVHATVMSARKGAAAAMERPEDDGSLFGPVVDGWRAEEARAMLSRQASIASGALGRIEALLHGDVHDAVRVMRRVARAHDEGGDAAVRAAYRSRVLDQVRPGMRWSDPEATEWLVRGWLPLNRLAFLFAVGGIGKTRLAAQLALALAAGHAEWLAGDGAPSIPLDGVKRRVLFVSWEDTERSMRRMLVNAAQALELGAPQDLLGDRFEFIYAGKLGPLWAPAGHSGHTSTLSGLTQAGHWLLDEMERYDVVILDPLAAVYASDENQRGLVRSFIGTLDEACQDRACTLLVLAHSSKEHLVSGSTDWQNGVRCVLAVEEDVETDKDPADKRRNVVVSRALRLSVVKMNEARKPMPRWIAERSGGWYATTRNRAQT